MARRVGIVPHTHWDREWYAPFPTFRARLVDLLDGLLPELDADPSYAHFMLDGQMAVVDDYLEVRPEAADRLRRLAVSGRLSMGPWYILMDEFLVSGECMVRNLQLGLARAASFGGAMPVGYLPDMFGHVAQMPQLLRQFGFEHAVVWRGVPSAVDRTAFWWRAPDGSEVRAEYLPQGYGNGAVVPDDAKALVQRIHEWAELYDDLLGGSDTPVLWMNGTDHLMPQPWLGRVVAEANDVQDDYELSVTSLASYVAAASSDGLPSWEGELRSGARANLLMGVASNRVDVKQAAARAERELERLAEPLAALFMPADGWPGPLLDLAWRDVIRNSAHDSICACSHDDVGLAVLHRFAEATRVAEAVTERALAAAGARLVRGAPVVINPSVRKRSGLVELWLSGPGSASRAGVQVLEGEPAETERPFDSAATAMMAIREIEWQRGILGVVVRDSEAAELARIDRTAFGELVTGSVQRQLTELVESAPEGGVVVVELRRPRQRVLARVDRVPGYGWQRWAAAPLAVDPVVVGDDGMSFRNELVSVVLDANEGCFSIDELTGLGRLVDDGDVGDTYNYCPPADDQVVERPVRGEVTVVEEGPLRGRLALRATYAWPERSDGSARIGSREVVVETVVELRAGERLVRVETTIDNQCRDHRVRAWIPLPEPAAGSSAECAFAVVERGLTAEGGPTETAMPTFPSRRFVRAGGLTVVHEGLLEYELIDVNDDRASTLALTLLRSTGLLSQGPMATRPLPAGPVVPAEAAQLQGRLTVRYAVQVGEGDPYALVDDAYLPMRAVEGTSTALGEGERGQALGVGGAEVSALRRAPSGALELRVFNPSAEPATVTVYGRTGWLVDLRGRPIERFDGGFDLGPWRIATALLD
ncbi:MAG: glycoside hydrolase family 38 C-terminal domain-containing protein [Acidimicrobiales bacterium]